jgi:PBP1b-binding outer membrane lipoprotein LpoB
MKTFKPAGNHQIVFNIFAIRCILLKSIYLAVILMGFVLGGCDFDKVEAQTETKLKEKNNMESIQTTTTIQNNKPPIDAAVSADTATATFAMG